MLVTDYLSGLYNNHIQYIYIYKYLQSPYHNKTRAYFVDL